MPITYVTISWALLGLISLACLYIHNSGRGFLVFITSRKYLFLFMIAAVLGMRQMNLFALTLTLLSLIFMYLDYKPYLAKCRRLRHIQRANHLKKD